jgi:hypothetical protein
MLTLGASEPSAVDLEAWMTNTITQSTPPTTAARPLHRPQLVLCYHLRGQVLGHVGDGGIRIVRRLRADHPWGTTIFLVDPGGASTTARPVAPVVVNIVVVLLHGYSSSPAHPWSSQAASPMVSLVAPRALKWATTQPPGRRSVHTSGSLLSSR